MLPEKGIPQDRNGGISLKQVRKKIFLLAVLILLVCAWTSPASRQTTESADSSDQQIDSGTAEEIGSAVVSAQAATEWNGLTAVYSNETGTELQNTILQIKCLDDQFILFELNTFGGRENSEDQTVIDRVGLMVIEADGSAWYESDDGKDTFHCSIGSDGCVRIADAAGAIPQQAEGIYLVDTVGAMQVNEELGIALLRYLPPESTGLTGTLTDANIQMQQEPDADGAYIFTASAADGTVVAQFLIASDLSWVLRTDSGTPMQIFGDTLG